MSAENRQWLAGGTILLALMVAIAWSSAPCNMNSEEACPTGHFTCPSDTTEVDEWAVLVGALIQVESNGDTLAVGRTNDLGALQLTPIYVADANRIVGEERWTLDDRRSLVKSLEMFETIQAHYNPSRNIAKAIKLHNPGAGEWYAERVYTAMEEIRNKETI